VAIAEPKSGSSDNNWLVKRSLVKTRGCLFGYLRDGAQRLQAEQAPADRESRRYFSDSSCDTARNSSVSSISEKKTEILGRSCAQREIPLTARGSATSSLAIEVRQSITQEFEEFPAATATASP
jgi:hypothetical protein